MKIRIRNKARIKINIKIKNRIGIRIGLGLELSRWKTENRQTDGQTDRLTLSHIELLRN